MFICSPAFKHEALEHFFSEMYYVQSRLFLIICSNTRKWQYPCKKLNVTQIPDQSEIEWPRGKEAPFRIRAGSWRYPCQVFLNQTQSAQQFPVMYWPITAPRMRVLCQKYVEIEETSLRRRGSHILSLCDICHMHAGHSLNVSLRGSWSSDNFAFSTPRLYDKVAFMNFSAYSSDRVNLLWDNGWRITK